MKAQESRPLQSESPLTVVPFRLRTAGDVSGTAQIRADQWYEVPSDWSLTLIDTKRTADPDDDVETALTPSDASGYTFEIDVQEKRAMARRHPARLGGEASQTQETSAPRPHRPETLRLTDASASKTQSPANSTPRFKVRVNASGTPVDPAADAHVEDRYAVSGPSPNPVQGGATLDIAVHRSQDVQVALYNVLGQQVATVHRGTLPGEKTTSLRLDVSSLSSGVYFVQIDGEDFTTTKKVTVIR
jgi:hypothetical protein